MKVDAEWDIERAEELAHAALTYMERVFPPGASFAPLAAHHSFVAAAERAGDLVAYENALRGWMKAGRRVALQARRGVA
jgi:hypothetical protein